MCIKHRNDWYLHQKEHDYWLWTLNTGSIFILNLLFWNKMIFKTWSCVPSVYPSLWQNVSGMKDANLVCSRVVRASSQPLSRSPPPSTRALTSSRRIWTRSRLRSCSSSLKWSAPRRRSARWKTQRTNREKKTIFCLNFVIYNAEKAGIQIGRGEVWDLWK